MEARVKVDSHGRIVLPADFRRHLNVETGQELVARLEDEEVRLFNPRRAVERAQAIIGRYVPNSRNLTDELLTERRAEVERDSHGA